MAINTHALLFDGVNDRATIPATSNGPTIKGMKDFTIMMWVKPAAGNTQYDRLWVERQGTGATIRLAVTPFDGKLRFEYSPRDGVQDTNYDFKYNWDDYWHHIAFVAQQAAGDSTYEIYLDATKVAEGQLVIPSNVHVDGSSNPIVTNTWPQGGKIYLGNASYHTSGGDAFTSTSYWKGKVDDIIVFNEAKSSSDIVTYFTSYDIWDMGDTGMFSYWRFDDYAGSGTDTTTVDSDNAWTMTITENTAMWTKDRPYLGDGDTDTVGPSTPGTPTTPDVTPDGFTAQWTASVDDAQGSHEGVYVQYYELQVATVSNFSVVLATYDVGTELSKAVNGLNPNATYYWRVRALDARANVSSWAATQTVVTDTEGDVTPPNAPTALSAPTVSISHLSFTVNFTASGSGDADGYKIDVSKSPTFSSYLTDYQNKNIGNVVTTVVSGLEPLTTYYVRLRTFDTSGNESANSTTLMVQTIAKPDESPPLPVEMLNATSISSKKATLNWEEGIDDVGVVKYHLDIAYDENFTLPVTIDSILYSDLNVGNVLSYAMINLTADTGYYYRVRAFDGADLESENPEPAFFRTEVSTLDEGGNISTVLFPTADAHIKSASATTNYGTVTTLDITGSGAANTVASLLRFDLTTQLGTVVNAMLRLYVNDASSNSAFIKVDNVSFTGSTVTWNTRPTVSGSSLMFVPLTVSQWVDVDISSLMIDGPAVYTVEITMTANDTAKFDSLEGTNMPHLVIESDPSTLTETERDLVFIDEEGMATNYIKNPRGELAVTTNWVAVGSTPAVLTTSVMSGRPTIVITCGGAVSGQGMRYLNNDIPAVQGEFTYLTLRYKVASGTAGLTISIYEYSSGGSLLTTQAATVTATTTYQDFMASRTITNASTAYVTAEIKTTGATACVIHTENWLLTKSNKHIISEFPFFDGETSGANWQGTVQLSRSLLPSSLVQLQSNYIGDGDQDNVVVPFFRRRREVDWISLDVLNTNQKTHNRTIRRVTSYFGPIYGPYNIILNPSFETDLTNWTLLNPNTNASIVRDDEVSYIGNPYATSGASIKLVWGAGAGSGFYSSNVPVTVGHFYGARGRILVPVGLTMRFRIEWIASNGSTIVSDTAAVTGQSEIIGDGTEWLDFYTSGTVPATTVYARVKVTVTSSTAGTAWGDMFLLSRTGIVSHVNPYRDGTSPDAFWIGAENASYTGYRILPETDYAFKHRYYDPDGVLNALEDGFYHVSDNYVTAKTSDNVTTLTDIVLEPLTDGINANIYYEGDDNQTMTMGIKWRRSDLSGYTSVPVLYDRQNKRVRAEIRDLKEGTIYTVRAAAVDTDGVYGGTGAGNDILIDSVVTTTNFVSAESQSMIVFNGFTLMGRNDDIIGVEEHDAFGLPERRVQVEDLPRSDGAIELQNLWGRRDITMRGFVAGESRSNLEDNKNMLKRALAPKKGRLTIDTLSNQQRYFTATCESLDIAEKAGENIVHLTWTAKFVCADPFSYNSDVSDIPEFTANNNSEIAVFNDGDVVTDPIITLRTTNSRAVTVTLLNTVTGERITPDTTILNNDRLIIDTNQYSVTKNGVEVDYAGGFLHLAAGANNLKFLLDSVLSSPSVKCTISWRDRYL